MNEINSNIKQTSTKPTITADDSSAAVIDHKTPQLDSYSLFYEETRAPRYASDHKSDDVKSIKADDKSSSSRPLARDNIASNQ